MQPVPSPRPRTWTPDELTWLELHWRPVPASQRRNFLKDFTRATGKTRTWRALCSKASELGIVAQENDEMPILARVAEDFQIHRNVLRNLINENPDKYPVVRRGRHIFIPEDTYEKLSQYYRVFNLEDLKLTVTLTEAEQMLCVCREAVLQLYRYGALRHIRRGPEIRVYRADIELVIELRKLRGKYWLEPIKDRLNEKYHQDRERDRKRMEARRQAHKIA